MTWPYRRTGLPAGMSRTATLWPGGINPLTVRFSASIAVPDTSWVRAMTTSSASPSRIVGDNAPLAAFANAPIAVMSCLGSGRQPPAPV